MLRVEFDDAEELAHGVVGTVLHVVNAAERVGGVDIGRIVVEQFQQDLFRLDILAEQVGIVGLEKHGGRIAGLGLEDAVDDGRAILPALRHEEGVGEHEEAGGRVRLDAKKILRGGDAFSELPFGGMGAGKLEEQSPVRGARVVGLAKEGRRGCGAIRRHRFTPLGRELGAAHTIAADEEAGIGLLAEAGAG